MFCIFDPAPFGTALLLAQHGHLKNHEPRHIPTESHAISVHEALFQDPGKEALSWATTLIV